MKFIRIGTDCSGIEAPIQALEKLNISYKHVFSCDIDPYCIQSIKANYKPKIIFTDMTRRKLTDIPDIDLYVCGFPCQPFSSAGLRKGTKDKRGTIFYHCLDIINHKQPSYFILENVKGLVNIEKGTFFKNIIKLLSDINYEVYYKVLNTKDYGIPQNRERLYIIGIRKDINKKFIWPQHMKMKKLTTFVDKNNKKKESIPPYVIKSNILNKIPKNSLFINISFPKNSFSDTDKICPCLTTANTHWYVPFQRKMTIKEMLRLQGFPTSFVQVVSDTQMRKQIGNSMSVCVLENIFKQLLL